VNNVYFACRSCQNYADAGHRWAASTLFQNRGDQFPLKVDLQAVWSYSEYWSGAGEHPHLAEVLAAARRFLLSHQTHEVVFGDCESFMNFDDPAHIYLEWLDETSITEPDLKTICLGHATLWSILNFDTCLGSRLSSIVDCTAAAGPAMLQRQLPRGRCSCEPSVRRRMTVKKYGYFEPGDRQPLSKAGDCPLCRHHAAAVFASYFQ